MQVLFDEWYRINRCNATSIVPLASLQSAVYSPSLSSSSSSSSSASSSASPSSASCLANSSEGALAEFWQQKFLATLDDDDGVDDDVTDHMTFDQRGRYCVRGEGCAAFTALCKFKGLHGALSGPYPDEGSLAKLFMSEACRSHGGVWNSVKATCKCDTSHVYNPFCLSPPYTGSLSPSAAQTLAPSSASSTTTVAVAPSMSLPPSAPSHSSRYGRSVQPEMPLAVLFGVVVFGMILVTLLHRYCRKRAGYARVAPEGVEMSRAEEEEVDETGELISH